MAISPHRILILAYDFAPVAVAVVPVPRYPFLTLLFLTQTSAVTDLFSIFSTQLELLSASQLHHPMIKDKQQYISVSLQYQSELIASKLFYTI